MNPVLISVGVSAVIVTIYVVVRLATRKKNRNPRYAGTYRGGGAGNGGYGSTSPAGTTPSSDPATYDTGYSGYYHFQQPHDSGHSGGGGDHSHSSHYTPEAPTYGGDIGSVDSSSYGGDSGGCDSGGGSSD